MSISIKCRGTLQLWGLMKTYLRHSFDPVQSLLATESLPPLTSPVHQHTPTTPPLEQMLSVFVGFSKI